jgi:hypothetical protein
MYQYIYYGIKKESLKRNIAGFFLILKDKKKVTENRRYFSNEI